MVVAILGLQGFFPLKGSAANGVGSVEYPVSERKRLALVQVFKSIALHFSLTICDHFRSREWVCPKCQQTNLECLPDPPQHVATTLSEPAGLRGLSHTQDPVDPPIPRPSPTPLPLAPERSSRPETSISDPDSATISTLVTKSEPSIPGERDSRGSQPAIRRRSHRPPLLLDTAICVLLVLLVALLFRRVL